MQSRRRRDTVSTSNRKPNITARSKSVRESLAVTKLVLVKNTRAQRRTTRKVFHENQIRG